MSNKNYNGGEIEAYNTSGQSPGYIPSIQPKRPQQRLFNTSQAAKYLGVSVDTIRTYADLGYFKARQLERRRVFTREELDRFIDSLPEYAPPGYPVGGGKPGGKEDGNGN